MSFTKFAKAEILEVKGAKESIENPTLEKMSSFDDYRTDDGYLYTRVRAISSRVNKNHDGWPSDELAKSYDTFRHKPIFVDHHNSDPDKARGVIVDAKLHTDDDKLSTFDAYYSTAPENHKPPTWIELLLEVDAKSFPRLAKSIIAGDIDGVSMGCNVEKSRCNICSNWASSPSEYCEHIENKGAHYPTIEEGRHTSKKSYEDCYDIGFFEISYVFDPADETALVHEVKTAQKLVHAEAGDLDGLTPEEKKQWLEWQRRSEEMAPTADEIRGLPERDVNDSGNMPLPNAQDEANQALAEERPPEEIQTPASSSPFGDHMQQLREKQQFEREALPGIRNLPEGSDPGTLQDQFHKYLLQNRQITPEDLNYSHKNSVLIPGDLPGYGEAGEMYQGQKCALCGNTVSADELGVPGLHKQRYGHDFQPLISNQGMGMLPQGQGVPTFAHCSSCGSDLEDGSCPIGHKVAMPRPPSGFNKVGPQHYEFGNCNIQVRQPNEWGGREAYGAGQWEVWGYDGANNPLEPESFPSFQEAVRYAQQTQSPGGNYSKTRRSDNNLPQAMMPHAPNHINTLRQDRICPQCGSDMEDGKCAVCNYEQPPEGFDNPDLNKAREVQENQMAEQPPAPDMGGDPSGGAPPGAAPSGAPAPGAAPMQMAGSTISNVTTKSIRNEVSAATKQPPAIQQPILPNKRKPSDNPLSTKTVQDQPKPVESNVKEKGNNAMNYTKAQVEGFAHKLVADRKFKDFASAFKAVTATLTKEAEGATPASPEFNADQRVNVQDVGAFDNVTLDNWADKRVDVEGVGAVDPNAEAGTEHQDVTKAQDTSGSGPTNTWSGTDGQTSPVTPETGDFFSVSGRKANLFPDDDNFGKQINVEKPLGPEGVVGEPTDTWSDNKANGREQANPVTNEVFPGIDVRKSNQFKEAVSSEAKKLAGAAKTHLLTAIRTAEAERDLGMIEHENYWPRVEELDQETPDELKARLDSYSKIKTTNTNVKRVATKIAATPRLGQPPKTAATEDTRVNDSLIFW